MERCRDLLTHYLSLAVAKLATCMGVYCCVFVTVTCAFVIVAASKDHPVLNGVAALVD